jgi:hypothetical protein
VAETEAGVDNCGQSDDNFGWQQFQRSVLLSGRGAFFFFLTIFRISEGEAGVMGVSSCLERMR